MTNVYRRDSLIFASLLLLAVSACSKDPETAADTPTDAPDASQNTGFLPPSPVAATDCGEHGRLQAEFIGALSGTLDWQAHELACEGMPRPEGRGARLRFAGLTEGSLALIIAIPELEPDTIAGELASIVTVIEEGHGRFFSSANLNTCWTDIHRQEALRDSGLTRIDGELYCIAPLAEVNGKDSITVTNLAFSGLITWGNES